MLDDATKAQLKSYLERATQPIEIVASLDDSEASGEVLSLLKDVAEASPLVKLTESRDDNHRKPSFSINRPSENHGPRFAGLPMFASHEIDDDRFWYVTLGDTPTSEVGNKTVAVDARSAAVLAQPKFDEGFMYVMRGLDNGRALALAFDDRQQRHGDATASDQVAQHRPWSDTRKLVLVSNAD